MFAWYGRMLAAKPFTTKVVTSSVLYTMGDVICQKLDGTIDRRGWDIRRSSKMTLYGAVIFAPTSHIWYGKVLPTIASGTSGRAVATKLALDQAVFGPIANLLFLSYSVLSNGGNMQGVKKKINDDFINIMKTNLMVWPAAMFINFKFVPVNYQVLYVNGVVMCWSAYLSSMVNKVPELPALAEVTS